MIWKSSITIQTEREAKRVQYFVTPPTVGLDCEVPCYGIGISDGRDTYTVAAFCPGREEAERVAQMLCRMEVTPATFFEVLDDYLVTRE